ncbi:MAG TPA: hypothetical protein VNL35_22605 [Chloroflexota bacterium]|nr:hypothetical protein [Chloroflexota bacterium]
MPRGALAGESGGMLSAANVAATLTLPVMPPFHLEGTVRLLQRQPSNRVDAWDRGRYLRVLPTVQGLRLLAVENLGTIDAPDLRAHVLGGSVTTSTLEELRRILTRILGLAVDPAPFAQAARDLSPLRIAVNALRGVRPPRFPTLFETLANVIPFQQVSLAAGVAVVGRIVERFGQPLSLDQHVFPAFPTPESVAVTEANQLHALGLSRAKATTLHELARRVLSGDLSEDRLGVLSTEAAMETLTAVPGIGPWSAGLILLRGFRRLEVFPAGDVGAARNLARLLGLERPTRLSDLQPSIEQMGDAKGWLYFYALGWRLLEQGLITPAPEAVRGRIVGPLRPA